MSLVDGVETVPKRPGSMTHRDSVGAEEPCSVGAVFHAPVGDYVDGRAGHDVAVCRLGDNGPDCAFQLGESVGTATKSGRPFWPQYAPGAEFYVVDAGKKAMVGEKRRVKLVEILSEIGFERSVAGDEVDGPGSLVVALRSVPARSRCLCG